jgi:hypothetical protein
MITVDEQDEFDNNSELQINIKVSSRGRGKEPEFQEGYQS